MDEKRHRNYVGQKYRGLALVFNISQFEHRPDDTFCRSDKAAMVDYVRLTSGLEALKFKIEMVSKGSNHPRERKEVKGWVTKQDIINKLTKTAKATCLKEAECLVIAFLSYGDQGLVFASDGILTKDDLMAPFLGTQCDYMIGKPKIFILRTGHMDLHQTVRDGADNANPTFIPAEADFHMFWCNMPENTYFFDGNEKYGDLFVRVLSNQMTTVAHYLTSNGDGVDVDWVAMYPQVTREIARQLTKYYPRKLEEKLKILPLQEDSLTKAYLLTHKREKMEF